MNFFVWGTLCWGLRSWLIYKNLLSYYIQDVLSLSNENISEYLSYFCTIYIEIRRHLGISLKTFTEKIRTCLKS